MLNKLMQMFGKKSAPEESRPAAAQPGEKKTMTDVKDLESFVDYVVRSLVDRPDSVRVETEKLNGASVIKITCAKEDMGKVIGRNGKTIMAIRSLVSGAGGRIGQKVSVEVVE